MQLIGLDWLLGSTCGLIVSRYSPWRMDQRTRYGLCRLLMASPVESAVMLDAGCDLIHLLLSPRPLSSQTLDRKRAFHITIQQGRSLLLYDRGGKGPESKLEQHLHKVRKWQWDISLETLSTTAHLALS